MVVGRPARLTVIPVFIFLTNFSCFLALDIGDSLGKNKDNEKTLKRDANTGRQKFSPRRRPLPGGAGRPKFNQLEMVTTCTYRLSLVKIDERNFELSW